MHTTASTRERRHTCWATAYWLEHCDGYRVGSSDGWLGFVEEVIWDSEKERPSKLLVRESHDPFTLIEVSIHRISEIRPEFEEILVFDEVAADAADELAHDNAGMARPL